MADFLWLWEWREVRRCKHVNLFNLIAPVFIRGGGSNAAHGVSRLPNVNNYNYGACPCGGSREGTGPALTFFLSLLIKLLEVSNS